MEAATSNNLDFGELSSNDVLKERIENFQNSINNVEKLLDTILSNDIYDGLSPEDKVRTQGVDPSQHDLKNEISRVKDYMAKSKKIYERKHIMPRIDQAAAGRFVRSGLWQPNEKPQELKVESSNPGKRKREESSSD